jgi:hypothetical protein
MSLDGVLRDARIWRCGQASAVALATLPTGFGQLNAVLPGGGWRLGALTEILTESRGIGALRLVMPALAQLSRAEKWLAWIEPPHIPYAPALAAHGLDLSRMLVVQGTAAPRAALWATEQSLRWGACSAALAWPARIDDRALRRLQLAAEIGQSWGLIFRSRAAVKAASPAALRLVLEPSGAWTAVRILKCRGGVSGGTVYLDLALR